MKYDLAEFEKRVEQGLIRKVEKGPLILYNYTDKCTYEKAWDDYTRTARGIIFEKNTGKLVAKPFPKFFNLGEIPETYLAELPNEPYTITEKVDGSLGIIYYYDNKWNVATRGSFNSEQAQKAEQILEKYDKNQLMTWLTYLVEIVYPENKIVVNYGNEEMLVLLAITQQEYEEFRPGELIGHAKSLKMPLATSFKYTIGEMIDLQKTMPKDQEGFVVRYKSGLRVKIKGHEYLRVHKIISQLSPLSAWEAMENGKVRRDYLEQVPEEYLREFQPIVDELEKQYSLIYSIILLNAEALPGKGTDKESLKLVGLYLKANLTFEHAGAMFPYLLGKQDALNKYIMKAIRPTGNVLK